MIICIYVYKYTYLSYLRPILNVLERNFAKLYSPNQRLSIDESMIAYKGRLSFKQYLYIVACRWRICKEVV